MGENGQSGRKDTTRGKYALFQELINERGLKVAEAGKLLGLTPGGAAVLATKLKKEGNVISTAMPPALLRKATRRAGQLLDGKTFGSLKEVKCSTVQRLIEATWARQYPTRQDPGAGGDTLNFTQININEIRTDPDTVYGTSPPNSGEKAIDAELVDGDSCE